MSAPLRLVLGLEEHFPAARIRRGASSSPAHFALLLTPSLPLPWHRPSVAGSPSSRQDHYPPPKINMTLIFVRQVLVGASGQRSSSGHIDGRRKAGARPSGLRASTVFSIDRGEPTPRTTSVLPSSECQANTMTAQLVPYQTTFALWHRWKTRQKCSRRSPGWPRPGS